MTVENALEKRCRPMISVRLGMQSPILTKWHSTTSQSLEHVPYTIEPNEAYLRLLVVIN